MVFTLNSCVKHDDSLDWPLEYYYIVEGADASDTAYNFSYHIEHLGKTVDTVIGAGWKSEVWMQDKEGWHTANLEYQGNANPTRTLSLYRDGEIVHTVSKDSTNALMFLTKY